MHSKIFKTGLLALMILVSSACKKETDDSPVTNNPVNNETPIPSNLVKVGETFIAGAAARAVVYSDGAMYTGFQILYIAMYDSASNKRLGDGHVELRTEMDMGMSKHSSPMEQDENESPSGQLWKPAAVFIMPGMWKLHLHFHNHKNNFEGEGEISVNIGSPAFARMVSFVAAADDSMKVFMSMLKPMQPKIGLNDFEITLHTKINADSFPAINHYTVEIEPEMVSMGHGSPNNVNPLLTANGHYAGKVNFTMSGDWRIHVKLRKDGVLIDDTHYFDLEF